MKKYKKITYSYKNYTFDYIIGNSSYDNWAIISEAIQTILRREGIKNPYEKLKELTHQKGYHHQE